MIVTFKNTQHKLGAWGMNLFVLCFDIARNMGGTEDACQEGAQIFELSGRDPPRQLGPETTKFNLCLATKPNPHTSEWQGL
ncbi:hypothetical protein BCR44DRAFT_226165 [Catenaria anguillulae PL171]|uniref:Uncharacterized protein n=1 Tax=Catenaria anguillulae PL171 TaxID=765915 RepID=A0A1Y2HV04_9FUNG|nr:hypothetical protein BCR44DRAFT_226165 [Catenaria anguillulae PL171]